jgi:hypothetical protein
MELWDMVTPRLVASVSKKLVVQELSGISFADGNAVDGWSATGYGGLFESNTSTGLRASGGGTYAAEFYGNVFAAIGFVASDRNLKENVTEFYRCNEHH